MRKKIFLLVLSLSMAAISLCGCMGGGSYVIIGSTEKVGNSYFEMSYDSFRGTRYEKIKLKQGDVLNLKGEVKTDSGDLKIKLLDKDNNEIYVSSDNPEDINEKININEEGRYKIQAEGNQHSGSFHISWDIE